MYIYIFKHYIFFILNFCLNNILKMLRKIRRSKSDLEDLLVTHYKSPKNNTEIELLNDNLNEMLENVSSLISLEK